MAVEHKGKQWDVDGDGVAVIVSPGIPTATTKQIKSKRLDKEIARATKQKERATSRVAQAQAQLTAVTQVETDLTALRATVTAEPEE